MDEPLIQTPQDDIEPEQIPYDASDAITDLPAFQEFQREQRENSMMFGE